MTSTKTRFDRNSTRKNTSIQKPEEPKNYNPAYILSIFSKERGLINQSASEFKTYSKKKKKKTKGRALVGIILPECQGISDSPVPRVWHQVVSQRAVYARIQLNC